MAYAAIERPRNFPCPMTSAACTDGECLHHWCRQQKAEENRWVTPFKTVTRRTLESEGWRLASVTGKHLHFRHTTMGGLATVPNDDRLNGLQIKKPKRRAEEAVLQYLSIVHHTPGWFVVRFPDFPSCLTGGRTISEARQMAREALLGHAAAVRAAGRPMPSPSPLTAVVEHRYYPGSIALMVVEVPAE